MIKWLKTWLVSDLRNDIAELNSKMINLPSYIAEISDVARLSWDLEHPRNVEARQRFQYLLGKKIVATQEQLQDGAFPDHKVLYTENYRTNSKYIEWKYAPKTDNLSQMSQDKEQE